VWSGNNHTELIIQLKFLEKYNKEQSFFMPLTATTNVSSHSKQKLNCKTTKSFSSRSALASGATYDQLFVPLSLRGLFGELQVW
jgi:hypothetical protein